MESKGESSTWLRDKGNEGRRCERLGQHRKHIGARLVFAGVLCVLWIACGLLVCSLVGAQEWSLKNFSRIDWQPTRQPRELATSGRRPARSVTQSRASTQPISPM